ncbi:MAG: hypothetical protein GKS01_06265 [Alphaproteobacteria bacterium]|nr:hypothetical protein [Alphaproteobacteria bacterium]
MQIKSKVADFKVLSTTNDREFAASIREDEIDILFELNGFTNDSRLKALAYKPAPIQIFWLGFPFTTGLEAMDYILLDPHVKPENANWTSEAVLEMPESWVAFDEFSAEPISERPPMERNGFVTFGSQNSPYKLTKGTIALWARVLKEVPGSRFLYVRPEADSAIIRQNLSDEFAKHDVGAERLFFVNNRKTEFSHLSFYDEFDVSLDTFPLTGGTTTCETLWMGIPVVTKYGPSIHQRLGYSHMVNLNLQELCADNDEDYVRIAVELANDPETLVFLRRELPSGLQGSAICRTQDYVQAFQKKMEMLVERHGLRS